MSEDLLRPEAVLVQVDKDLWIPISLDLADEMREGGVLDGECGQG